MADHGVDPRWHILPPGQPSAVDENGIVMDPQIYCMCQDENCDKQHPGNAYGGNA